MAQQMCNLSKSLYLWLYLIPFVHASTIDNSRYAIRSNFRFVPAFLVYELFCLVVPSMSL